MMNLDFAAFSRAAKKGNLIALFQSVPADLETPVSAFLKIANSLREAFLLESAEQEEKIGRYSIIGLTPARVISCQGVKLKLREKKSVKSFSGADMLSVLENIIEDSKLANPEVIPGFSGGLVGYFSYENVQNFESVKLKSKPGPIFPDAVFFQVQNYVVFDHFRKTMTVVAIVDKRAGKNLRKLYQQGEKRILEVIRRLRKNLPRQSKKTKIRVGELKSNMTRKAFRNKVEKIKAYVRAGDCIQVVLSQRFSVRAPKDDFGIYRALRSLNPSPYMFYFKFGKSHFIGSSPELLVKKEGRHCDLRPIAGTRPRGRTIAEDQRLEASLKKSRKELAEHLMLVDLGRNDLGRVCEFNSIKVKDYAHVERFSHVMHLVSDISGKLKQGKNEFDLVKASFPAGTVSGAPKIRAMEIIDELEAERRGPYAGCLGFFGFDRNMETCITIRTLMNDGKKIYIQAGAGIVKDSNPEREYQETVNKAKAMIQAMRIQKDI